MTPDFFDSFWFTYVLLPFLIFLSRVIDVSMDTLRIVFISKGDKIIAPILGFFQVLIWIIAITQIMQNLNNWVCYLAYAGGFAIGNYIGLIIEQKLAIGVQLIRVITHKDASPLIEKLKSKGYKATSHEANGTIGLVHIIYLLEKRSVIKKIIPLIKEYNPKAFFTIEDIRFVSDQNEFITAVPKKGFIWWISRGRIGR